MTSKAPPKIRVVFYKTPAGGEAVLDWLRGLDDADRREIGLDLMRVQYRWPVGMPLCRSMGNGLWEMRTTLPGGRIVRLMFCVSGGAVTVLSGFLKKAQKTPDEELALARKRMKELLP